jgi:hypothetical protein
MPKYHQSERFYKEHETIPIMDRADRLATDLGLDADKTLERNEKYFYDPKFMTPEEIALYHVSKASRHIPKYGKYTAPIGTSLAVAPLAIKRGRIIYALGKYIADRQAGRVGNPPMDARPVRPNRPAHRGNPARNRVVAREPVHDINAPLDDEDLYA